MAELLNIERHEDRPNLIRFVARVRYQVDGETCEHAFAIFYRTEPAEEELEQRTAEILVSCELFAATKAALKGDVRAADCWIGPDGRVRVLLANRACPKGCVVESRAHLQLVLKRLPPQQRRADLGKLKEKFGAVKP